MSSQEILFKLLRIALGKEAPAPLPNDVNWKEVYDLSLKQGVGAIACDGMLSLTDCSIDEDLRYMWMGQSMVIEQKYYQQQSSIAKLASFYHAQGIRMMLLKGYGLSLNYPIPEHRPTGDIDIFLLPIDFEKKDKKNVWRDGDKSVSALLNIKVEDSHEHHTTFLFEGQTVENHYDFVNTKGTRSSRFIESELKRLAYKDSVPVGVLGQEIVLPMSDLNAIFIVRHMGQHFAGSEITLRHLLDWGTFMEKYHESIDWNYVVPFWKKMGLFEFVQCVNGICVKELGFSESYFREYLSDDTDLMERILRDILKPEFGEEKPKGCVVKVIVFKIRRFFANRWKRRLIYKEGIASQFVMGSWAHLLRYKTITD